MKNTIKILILLLTTSFIYAQQVDIEGDTKILGKIDIIKAIGDSSVFIGANAGIDDDGGNSNTFVGGSAGRSNTTGNSNSFFGLSAGRLNTSGQGNSFFGVQAGKSNTSGENNSFFGGLAGLENTIGENNSFFGALAGAKNTEGVSNSFFGEGAGFGNTRGDFNSFFGSEAGKSNTEGNDNSFFGYEAGKSNTEGENNSFFGLQAGESNETGNDDSFFGEGAGRANTRGDRNSFFGVNAGESNTIGDFNSFFGYGAGSPNDNQNRAIAIGHFASVTCDNCAAIGGTGLDAVKVGITNATPMTKLHILGGVDASLTAHGYIVNGPITGQNLVIDDNEIIARNNGNGNNLFLNAGSGNVAIGGTTPPTAKLDVDGKVRIRDLPFGTGINVVVDTNGNLLRSSAALKSQDQNSQLLDKAGLIQIEKITSIIEKLKSTITSQAQDNEELKTKLAIQQQQIEQLEAAVAKLIAKSEK